MCGCWGVANMLTLLAIVFSVDAKSMMHPCLILLHMGITFRMQLFAVLYLLVLAHLFVLVGSLVEPFLKMRAHALLIV